MTPVQPKAQAVVSSERVFVLLEMLVITRYIFGIESEADVIVINYLVSVIAGEHDTGATRRSERSCQHTVNTKLNCAYDRPASNRSDANSVMRMTITENYFNTIARVVGYYSL